MEFYRIVESTEKHEVRNFSELANVIAHHCKGCHSIFTQTSFSQHPKSPTRASLVFVWARCCLLVCVKEYWNRPQKSLSNNLFLTIHLVNPLHAYFIEICSSWRQQVPKTWNATLGLRPPPLKVLCTSKVYSLTTFQREAVVFIFDVECRRSLEVYTTVVRYRGQFIKAEVCSCERRGLSFFWNPCLRWKYNLFVHVHKQEECERRFCRNKSCAIKGCAERCWKIHGMEVCFSQYRIN